MIIIIFPFLIFIYLYIKATVIAVELLREELVKRGVNIYVLELDWFLWQWGERIKEEILPHHRTLTIYY